MRFAKITFVLILFLTSISARGEDSSKKDESPLPNQFNIHLQDGFDGREVVVTVDSREVYRGRPKTDERRGWAANFSTAAATARPVISISIADRQISEKRHIDLNDGVAVGIKITRNGQVEVRQAKGFGYE